LPQSKRTFWKAHDLNPHLVKTFKLSNDKHFVDNVTDIDGLYLEPCGIDGWNGQCGSSGRDMEL